MAFCGCQLDEDRDTVARRRNDQGFHECETFGTWSLELEQRDAWDNCKKNKKQNNHKNFIPVLEFSRQNLPIEYRGEGDFLLACIEAVAALTVRLRVHHVSGNRPDGYTFSGFKNKDVKHLGTGWVYRVSPGDGPCPCVAGRCSANVPSTSDWWKIEIFTACHVVYDQREAKSTEADLFYDSETAAPTTLNGHDVEDNSERDDVCILHCVSHDQELARRLTDSVKHYEFMKKGVRMSTLCVVVSHPHGMPKMVTVGEIVGKAKHDLEDSMMTDFMFTYDAATCNGSSGAPVLSVITQKTLDPSGVWPGAGPHSGHLEENLNSCGSGCFYVGADVLDWTILQDSMKNLKTETTFADVSFILIGKTGVGKSTLGNSILKRNMFLASASTQSVTRDSEIAVATVNDTITKVVDMISVYNISLLSSEGFFMKLKRIMSVSPENAYIFLFVVRFGDSFTEEDEDMISCLKKVLGNDVVRDSCIVVVTHGDLFFDSEDGVSFSEWWRGQSCFLRELIEECEKRVLLFDNLTDDESVKNKQNTDLFEVAKMLRAKGRRYTQTERMLAVMNEMEVRGKALYEERTLLEESLMKRPDRQALLRAERLVRYVKTGDRVSNALLHLENSEKILHKMKE
ncbi:immune-associated nucleotide-binding protein 12 [Elysia marginata]|uniref:Immune-associated nucleotide-binding protein 12 n=1 Tax=Elysia marginata TaxID=1093978 RepID=A0AAV4IHA6_9GAST|nr:immune-associated nucleotide-binding protein 12 [Elysia marginata]